MEGYMRKGGCYRQRLETPTFIPTVALVCFVAN